ncbi:MAG: family 16 glycoside hydrolase, partial [Planctomycetia bacterium]
MFPSLPRPFADRFSTAGLVVVWVIAAAAVARAAQPPTAVTSAPPEPAGMQRLFDGNDLDGWDGDPRLWSVRDGVIHGETTPEKVGAGTTFLIWKGGEMREFDLRR